MKSKQIHLRVSDEELDKLRNLSKPYPTLSSFILDACWHFDAAKHVNKIKYLDEKIEILNGFRNEVSKIGTNFNQLVQYTNRCISMGIYLPNTADEILKITNRLSNQLDAYYKKVQDAEKMIKRAARII